MKEEPFFIINDFLDRERRELENVINIVQGSNTKVLERSAFLRNFTNLMFNAHRKSKVSFQPGKEEFKSELLERRRELLKRLGDYQDKPQPKTESPKLTKELILSKETKKPLVRTEFDETGYKVAEPELTEQDKGLINELKSKFDETKLKSQLEPLTKKYNVLYSEEYYDKIRYYLIRDTKRFGKVSPLIEDKEIKEIVCPGPEKQILVTYKDKHDIPTNIILSAEELNNFIKVMAAKTKQEPTQEKPFLNTALENLTINANIGTEFIKPKFVIVKN